MLLSSAMLVKHSLLLELSGRLTSSSLGGVSQGRQDRQGVAMISMRAEQQLVA